MVRTDLLHYCTRCQDDGEGPAETSRRSGSSKTRTASSGAAEVGARPPANSALQPGAEHETNQRLRGGMRDMEMFVQEKVFCPINTAAVR